jgi:branched-chain amino acid transport system ATP-binding protein
MSILECDHVSCGYDGLAVVRDVSFALEPGEVLAILGPNGAGKTTLLLTLAGFLPVISGSIRFDGSTTKGSAREMNRAGLVLVPDSRALFTQLTANETLALAARHGGLTRDEVYEIFPSLRARAKLKVGMLSGGEQQMLAVARALVQGPRALLIDEMSMGLAPIVVETLMPTVRTVADHAGAAVILVEQHVGLALDVADRAIVLVHGEVTLAGAAPDLRADSGALDAAYLKGTAFASPSGD